ncbi:PAS domain S-box protein [Pedobacter frigiditerrae]|uniref:histidine kinase n=1 Tax=Pedobacter frigiditerrae TaxID=2530452 RepID=A0A4R0ML75_9SPHI|nr:ATP-binding protein [Pedobacter frigiditerrae]TCC87283.1 PAS domain S-box protein [Pedobacter frigiditerrae]
MLTNLKILIVEDNESDADLLLRELNKIGLDFKTLNVQTRKDFESALITFEPDLILSDYALPSFDAVTAFGITQVNHAHVPFIIVSGFIGEENAVELIKNGVTDYVSKERLYTLTTKIKRALDDSKIRKEKIITDKKLIFQSAELQTLNQQLENRVIKRTKALAESENRFRNMMETIPQISWTNTVDGEVVYYNQRWYGYTGLTEVETKNLGFDAAIHPEDLKLSAENYYTIIKGNKGGEFQIRAKRADGDYRWHLIRLMPILDQQDKIELWVGTATDIQELRLLQQQKDDFINIASHELKTPMTSLKGSLQLLDRLKDNLQSPMLPKLILQANKSMDKVNALINELLNSSMANDGKLHIKAKKFRIAEMIDQCCLDVRSDGKYIISTTGDLQLEVAADALRIEQIINNFVNNAIKYAPGSKNIKILIEKINESAKVSVIDNGPGIPKEKLKHLFDRYYRVNSSESQYNGLGLGLYICSEIIKKHDGTIGVESEQGKGTAFWFTLPLEQALLN